MSKRKKLDFNDFKMMTLEELKKKHPEALEKTKNQTFTCLLCGKENKGLQPCDHKKIDQSGSGSAV